MHGDPSIRLQGDALAMRVYETVMDGPEGDPAVFDELAPEVFRRQFENNDAYRDFCEAAGVTPNTLRSWHDIPAYPTDVFKNEIVASFPMDDAVQAIMTSGTTSPNQRGRIFRDEIGRELIFTANRIMTAAYLFPDFQQGNRCRILILTPSPDVAPSMGMAVGMEQTRQHFGTPDSHFLVKRSGVDVKALVADLRESENSGVPVALIGATSAYVYFLKACKERNLSFRLPEGSRLGDGGGYRGRFGEMTRDDYYNLAQEVLGVPSHHCVNILGMGESATNYADNVLRDRILDRPVAPRHKHTPPWTRVQAVSPDTGQVLPHGEVGLLRHYDLVNLPTVIGVQTDNLGFTDNRGGFEIIGRAKVVAGKVAELPSERSVGPMSDTPVFRLLEAYMNFSIDFKMGRIKSSDNKAGVSELLELRKAADEQQGVNESDPVASCPVVVDDLVAGTDDPHARKRACKALDAFQQIKDSGPEA